MKTPPMPAKLRQILDANEELPLREVADALGLHRNTLYRYCRTGFVKSRSHGLGNRKKRRMISRREVEALWRKLHSENTQ